MVWYGKGYNDDEHNDSYECIGFFCHKRIFYGNFCYDCENKQKEKKEVLKNELPETSTKEEKEKKE